MWLGSLLALAILIPTRLAAQTNIERVVNGSYTRSHDYDLLHQRIEVKNFDWDSTSFDGRVTTTVASLRPGLEAVILDMDRQLEVRRVTGGPNTSLEFERPGDSLVVRLPRPAGFRDTVRFAVEYHGRVQQGRGLYFFPDEPGRPHRHQQLYSGGGTDGNPRWFPTYGAPDDKMTWELIATVPARLTVVSNGRLVSDQKITGGLRTAHWVQEQPASSYLVSLVAAPLVKLSDRWRYVPVDYYVYPEDSALARPLFGSTPDMIEIFSRLTGVRYPWGKYSQTTVADFVGGMENVGATTLVDWLPDRRAYLDQPWYRETLIPHELAHQWFGNLVTAENWANYWLHEGIAQFMPGQYWGVRLGRHAEDDFYLGEYQEFLAKDARRRMPLATYNSNNVYPKGALVMEMLKKHLGPERFWAAINRFLIRHAFKNATSDDLRQAVLEATGESLSWFWSQWIYQAGYPQFTIRSTYDSAAASLTLNLSQTQQDTAKADSTGFRFTTPRAFRAPVTIRVGQPARDLVVPALVERREQVIRIDSVRSPPTMVVFDDDNAVLKTLVFEQPTKWLANQLASSVDLWNRWWAIEQLARRPSDSLAGYALARAARTADYSLTRAQAAASLAKFPKALAAPALQSAARDTSARVREAAIRALGEVGGKDASLAVRRAWTSDSSYRVRAAALSGLVRLGAPEARSAVLEGLKTSSYLESIQNAAIGAAVQHPDSEMIAGLERAAGDQSLPSVALAALAGGGNPQAKAALARLLADRRPWVRAWALDATRDEAAGGS